MPPQGKTMDENQLGILRKCVKGKISRSEASRQCGVSERTIARWRVRYEAEGVAGFLPRKQTRKYSPELKEAAVRAYLAGCGSVLEICKQDRICQGAFLRKVSKNKKRHTKLP